MPAKAGKPALSAVSDWVPSAARQAENRRLSTGAEQQVLRKVSQALGEDLQRPTFNPAPLELQAWLASPASRRGARPMAGARSTAVMPAPC